MPKKKTTEIRNLNKGVAQRDAAGTRAYQRALKSGASKSTAKSKGEAASRDIYMNQLNAERRQYEPKRKPYDPR